jgi:hypothetical protein
MINSTARHTFPVTCRVTGLEHQVADESFAVERDDIRLPAMCGDQLIPASGDTPPGKRCRPCWTAVTTPPAPPPPPPPIDVADLLVREKATDIPRQRDRAAHRRPSLFARIVHGRPGTGADESGSAA